MKSLLLLAVVAQAVAWSQVTPAEIRLYFSSKDLACGDQSAPATTIPASGDSELDRSFQIAGYDWNATNPTSISSTTTGLAAGKATFEKLTLQRYSDTCSPLIFRNLGAGRIYAKMRIVFFDGQKRAVVTIDLRTALISNLYVNGAPTDLPSEALSIEFGGVIITAQGIDASGKLTTPVVGGWDRTTNKSLP